MTHSIKLVAGSTEVELTTGNYRLIWYVPQSAAGETALDVLADARTTVTEECQIDILGDDGPDVQTNFRAVEALLNQARYWEQRHMGDRVYVVVQMSEEADEWRSPLVSGRIIPDDDAWQGWANHFVRASLAWTRYNFFEENTETELAIGNDSNTIEAGAWVGFRTVPTYYESTSARTTGGVTIYNHDDSDAGHTNWVAVESAAIEGVLPAPVRVEMTSVTGVTPIYSDFWMGSVDYADLSSPTYTQILEGETGTSHGTSTSTTSVSTSSGGSYRTVNWAASTQTALWSYELTQTMLNNYAGRYVQVLGRFESAPSTSLRLQVYLSLAQGFISSSYVVGKTSEILMDGHKFVDFGAIQLPPSLAGLSGLYPLYLHVAGRKSGGGTVDLDFLALLPTESSRVLRVVPASGNWPNNDKVIDDGINDQSYAFESLSSGYWPAFVRQGPGVYLRPGRDNLVYFWNRERSSAMVIARTFSVRMYYRARRRTL